MNLSFETWLTQVDAIAINETGCATDVLVDWCWHSIYDDGCTPQEAWDAYIESEADPLLSSMLSPMDDDSEFSFD